MYLKKAKKYFEQQDVREVGEKRDRHVERYQRDAVLLNSPAAAAAAADVLPWKTKETEQNEEFRPEDLPDGACFRPRSVLVNSDTDQTAIRSAEYIGSFSVVGDDQNSRTKFVKKQLEDRRTVAKSKRVLLVISLSGVKVCSSDGESVYMAHALKRISYATCDPEFCQFSFLAREPKGPINIQFCHAFITKSPQETEELNTIIGNAFKMAYAQQREKQPTFNELIERQIIEQKAKFQEDQEQAQRDLQQKLNEIATPTPFSEKVIQRMEMRRQLSEEAAQEREKEAQQQGSTGTVRSWLWGRQTTERTKHRSPVTDIISLTNVRGTSPPPLVKPSSSPAHISRVRSEHTPLSQRNSAPAQVISSHPISVTAIKECFENHNNSGKSKLKGSPVTALKDEIDRHFNGLNVEGLSQDDRGPEYLYPVSQSKSVETEKKFPVMTGELSQVEHAKMLNRPLPALPADTNGHQGSSGQQQRTSLQSWSSSDDDNQSPTSSRVSLRQSVTPYSSSPRQREHSPKTKSQRPHSGAVFDSKKTASSSSRAVSCHVSYCGYRSSIHCHQTSPLAKQNFPEAEQYDQRCMTNQKSPKTQHSKESQLASPSGGQVLRYQNDSPFQYQGCYDNSAPNSPSRLESLMGLDRSHIEDETLRHASWYQAGIPREIALEILQQEEIGSFIVRDSTSHPGCYALSVKVPKFENPTGISHYLILKTHRGVKLKGLDKEWPNLTALVTHHTVMREMLPCTLKLPRNSKNPTFKDSDKEDKDEDPDYQRLSDFSSMMADLKM